jgi:hypothetical protein
MNHRAHVFNMHVPAWTITRSHTPTGHIRPRARARPNYYPRTWARTSLPYGGYEGCPLTLFTSGNCMELFLEIKTIFSIFVLTDIFIYLF